MDLLAADPATDTVILQLPASSAYLSVLRTATAGLAARAQFTLDEIEDLRIAVDEACAMLLARELDAGETPQPGDDLTCQFVLGETEIQVFVSVPAGNRVLPSRDTFAWQVLSALAGDVEASTKDDRLCIALTKKRAGL